MHMHMANHMGYCQTEVFKQQLFHEELLAT